MEMMLTGDAINGIEAERRGWATAAVQPADELDAYTLQVAERIAQLPRGLVRLNKRYSQTNGNHGISEWRALKWLGAFGQFEGKAKDCFRVGSMPSFSCSIVPRFGWSGQGMAPGFPPRRPPRASDRPAPNADNAPGCSAPATKQPRGACVVANQLLQAHRLVLQ